MNSVLRVNKGLVSCKCIDVLFHMLVGLASIVLTLFMQLAPVTYASTGAIFQRVDDIVPALLKNSYLIKDKTLFEWVLNLPASPLSSGSGGSDDDDGNNQNNNDSKPEPLNAVYEEELWLAQVSAEKLLSKTLKNKRRLLRIIHKKLQRAIAEGNSGLVKILGDRLMLIEVELDELERSGQQSDPVVLSRVRAAFVSDQQELQDYDDRFLRLALPEHPVTVNVDPDSLIIRSGEMSQQQMRLYLQWLYSAAGLLYSELKQRLLRKLQRAAPYSESHLVAVDSLLTGLETCVRQFRSLIIPDSHTQRIGRQMPNSDTQTDHSEKPSASQPSTSQSSTSRQGPVSGSGLGDRRYTRCLDGDDDGNGNPSRNGHTRSNHCPMCNNGPCEYRAEDNSGYPESYDGKGITDLPNEIVLKILSNLDIRTISVCRRVNSSWLALINESHLPALSFCRGLHYQPIPQTVELYHSSTRDWLTGFDDEGKKLADELDTHLEDKYFPKMLFFAIAEVLARTELLTCRIVFIAQHTSLVNNASFSPDGHHLVTASSDHTAKTWELVDGQWQEKATIEHEIWVVNASFSPDGHHLVTAIRHGTGKIWGLVNGQWQEKATIEHSNRWYNASFSPDGHHLVTAAWDGSAKIWGLVDGQWLEKATIQHNQAVTSASFSPDGHHLVTASEDKTVTIWELLDGQWLEKATIRHANRVNSAKNRYAKRVINASFSPDGHHLVTVAHNHTAKIWRLVDGQWQEKATIQHKGWVKNACFSPDGHHLVTASHDYTAKIWGLVDGQWLEKTKIRHKGFVNNASFSPDGHHLVTASNDETAKIWGVVDGQWLEKATIRHYDGVRNASFSPDGHHFVTVSGGTATIWLVKRFVSDQQEQQVYDLRSLRLVTVNVDPDSLRISDSPTQRIGRQVPNSDTQTDHSEKPSASQPSTSQPSTSQPSTSQPSTSQPSTSQPSTSRQAPVSGSDLGERQYAGCPDGDDGSNGNPSHNGHTRNNHCSMCNDGPCEHKVDDNSGHPESYDGKGITDLPNEMVLKILSNLDVSTISVCRHVNSNWKALIDENHLLSLSLRRAPHYQLIPHAVQNYHSSIRGWLTSFGNEGRKLADELDKHLEDKYFPEMLFFAIAEVLARTKLLTCQNVCTSPHYYWMRNASFSPDRRHLVTASNDKTAGICEFVDGQWQKKATIEYDYPLKSASFSADGHRLVTVFWNATAKTWELIDGQWLEKATICSEGPVRSASFSPDGHYLVTASNNDKTVKIWRLVGGQWQKKATIHHKDWVRNASFSPDGNRLATVLGSTVKIWGFVDGQWLEKATIQHDRAVTSASFSPDGHHLVTALGNTAKIWGPVDGQWLEKATIKHGDRVRSASFRPYGYHLVTTSSDTSKLWLVKSREGDSLNINRDRAEPHDSAPSTTPATHTPAKHTQ